MRRAARARAHLPTKALHSTSSRSLHTGGACPMHRRLLCTHVHPPQRVQRVRGLLPEPHGYACDGVLDALPLGSPAWRCAVRWGVQRGHKRLRPTSRRPTPPPPARCSRSLAVGSVSCVWAARRGAGCWVHLPLAFPVCDVRSGNAWWPCGNHHSARGRLPWPLDARSRSARSLPELNALACAATLDAAPSALAQSITCVCAEGGLRVGNGGVSFCCWPRAPSSLGRSSTLLLACRSCLLHPA